VTATSSRPRARAVAATALAVTALCALTACGSSATPDSHPSSRRSVPPARVLAARPAPAGWHTARLPDGQAVLAYPPEMHLISGDKGEVSAARFSSKGAFLMYLNATPKQGDETLAGWPDFRLDHLTDDDASTARMLAESFGVRFIGGTGSCVVDAYVTKVKSNHYTELACFVQGKTGASVVIAAAPTAHWAALSGVLKRAVAAYSVR